MKINHYLTFSGPAYVPTSVDETSARETTAATVVDVGITTYARSVDLSQVNMADIEDRF